MSNMKKIFAAFGVAILLLVGGAAQVFAHNNKTTADCNGLSVNLTHYNTQPKKGEDRKNSVKVWVDGNLTAHDNDFGSTYVNYFPFENKYVNHTYRVQVKAWDDTNGKRGWSFDTKTVEVKACDRPEKPEPIVEVITRGVDNCELGGFYSQVGTRTTDWRWDSDKGEWVKTEPVDEWTDEFDKIRDYTDEEKVEKGCVVPTPTPTPTEPTPTDTPTGTPTPTPTPTEPTEEPTPTPSPSETETPTPTPTSSETPSTTPTATPSVTPTDSSTVSPSPSNSPSPNAAPALLAQTGFDGGKLATAGVLAALLGAWLVYKSRRRSSKH